MECISNFKIVFFTKVEYKENFRNKKSKQCIKGALPLNSIKHKTKEIRTLTANKMLSQITPKISPCLEHIFSFHLTQRLPSEA